MRPSSRVKQALYHVKQALYYVKFALEYAAFALEYEKYGIAFVIKKFKPFINLCPTVGKAPDHLVALLDDFKARFGQVLNELSTWKKYIDILHTCLSETNTFKKKWLIKKSHSHARYFFMHEVTYNFED